MRFSIIVPVYNAEKYLAECVGSVLRQEDGQFELILVDDGSAEACARACDEVAASSAEIRVVHQRNQGPLLARLNGVRAAEGEYCLFLDADDLLAPGSLRILSEAIERHHSPDMAIYSYVSETPGGKIAEPPFLFPEERSFDGASKKELYALFLTGTGLNSIWTKAVRRDVFFRKGRDLSPYAALRCAEDRLLSMAAVSDAQTVVYLPERLYRYRLFPGSATRAFSLAAVDRSNTRILYPFELECLRCWEMTDDDSLMRLKASYLLQTLYVFDRFYLQMRDTGDRERLIAYDWKSFVPGECLAVLDSDPHINDVQRELFHLLMEKDAAGLEKYFKRKQRRTALKKIKKALFL